MWQASRPRQAQHGQLVALPASSPRHHWQVQCIQSGPGDAHGNRLRSLALGLCHVLGSTSTSTVGGPENAHRLS